MWTDRLGKALDENSSLVNAPSSASLGNLLNDDSRGTFTTFNLQQEHDASKTRLVFVNDPISNTKYSFCDNSVKTTKYTFYNFIFKNLYQQFHRFANCCKFLSSTWNDNEFQRLSLHGPSSNHSGTISDGTIHCIYSLKFCFDFDNAEGWLRRCQTKIFRSGNKQ